MLDTRQLIAPCAREDKVVRRYVVSAPRSGLNWLRFCAEYFYGVPTPGKHLLVSNEGNTKVAFARAHNPLKDEKPEGRIDPSDTEGGRVVLILRHPLETFVRMAEKKLRRFDLYTSNIKFYTASEAAKAVFYYEDLVKSPQSMASALDFLQIEPVDRPKPTCEDFKREWEAASQRSRAAYDINQVRGGGSKTKANPFDFTFHQRSLWPWQRARVWNTLSSKLTLEEMGLLERYRG